MIIFYVKLCCVDLARFLASGYISRRFVRFLPTICLSDITGYWQNTKRDTVDCNVLLEFASSLLTFCYLDTHARVYIADLQRFPT